MSSLMVRGTIRREHSAALRVYQAGGNHCYHALLGIADTAVCPPDTRAQTLRAPGLSRKSHGAPGVPLGGAIVLRVLACTRSSRDAGLRKSHAASRRLALGLPSSRCGVCCPRAALASMHAPRPGCPALLPAPRQGSLRYAPGEHVDRNRFAYPRSLYLSAPNCWWNLYRT